MPRKKRSTKCEETSPDHIRDLKNAMDTIEITCRVLIDLLKEEQVLHMSIKQVKKGDITQIITLLTTFSALRTQALRKYTNKKYYNVKQSASKAKNGKKTSIVGQFMQKLF